MTETSSTPDLSVLYTVTQDRLAGLLSGLDERALHAPVPACPGWAVRDVLAHLTAVADDALAGRLTGPPTEEQTAAQVTRFADRDAGDMLALWGELAAPFGQILQQLDVWPGVVDVVSHEQDIRGAVGQPGARDCEAVLLCADRMIAWLAPPVPMRVTVEDAEYRVGPAEGTGLGLVTTRFEALRWRLGRRSRAQMAAFDWSGDPAPVLDHLAIFGPAAADIVE